MADPQNPTPDNAMDNAKDNTLDSAADNANAAMNAQAADEPHAEDSLSAAATDSRYVPPTKKPSKIRTIIIALIILGLIGLVAWGLIKDKRETRSAPVTIQGHMEVEQTPVAAKVAGRIANIYVKEGDEISVGTRLIDMDSPEINAKVEEAQAGKELAQSQLDKANNGARPQEIEMAKYQYDAAQSAADLAKVTYERINRLAAEGLMSRQKRDEAYTNYVASVDKAKIAKAQYELAKTGARSEDKTAAQAQVSQVEGKLKEAKLEGILLLIELIIGNDKLPGINGSDDKEDVTGANTLGHDKKDALEAGPEIAKAVDDNTGANEMFDTDDTPDKPKSGGIASDDSNGSTLITLVRVGTRKDEPANNNKPPIDERTTVTPLAKLPIWKRT